MEGLDDGCVADRLAVAGEQCVLSDTNPPLGNVVLGKVGDMREHLDEVIVLGNRPSTRLPTQSPLHEVQRPNHVAFERSARASMRHKHPQSFQHTEVRSDHERHTEVPHH